MFYFEFRAMSAKRRGGGGGGGQEEEVCGRNGLSGKVPRLELQEQEGETSRLLNAGGTAEIGMDTHYSIPLSQNNKLQL